MYFSIPAPSHNLSSFNLLSGPNQLFLTTKLSHISLTPAAPKIPFKSTIIRMGGGPRTYPGGVSKWQWKRMQAKKSKQLLKARLARERQIYEMRKRAELRAAVSELERPWEVVKKAPTLFSVGADEQLKVLADRFQKPGGFDMWSDKDGPQLFQTVDEIPSARFFPKGVVHSVKPYGIIGDGSDGETELGDSCENSGKLINGSSKEANKSKLNVENPKNGKNLKGKSLKKGNRRRNYRVSDSGKTEFSGEKEGKVYDMNLQRDGSYKFQRENRQRGYKNVRACRNWSYGGLVA